MDQQQPRQPTARKPRKLLVLDIELLNHIDEESEREALFDVLSILKNQGFEMIVNRFHKETALDTRIEKLKKDYNLNIAVCESFMVENFNSADKAVSYFFSGNSEDIYTMRTAGFGAALYVSSHQDLLTKLSSLYAGAIQPVPAENSRALPMTPLKSAFNAFKKAQRNVTLKQEFQRQFLSANQKLVDDIKGAIIHFIVAPQNQIYKDALQSCFSNLVIKIFNELKGGEFGAEESAAANEAIFETMIDQIKGLEIRHIQFMRLLMVEWETKDLGGPVAMMRILLGLLTERYFPLSQDQKVAQKTLEEIIKNKRSQTPKCQKLYNLEVEVEEYFGNRFFRDQEKTRQLITHLTEAKIAIPQYFVDARKARYLEAKSELPIGYALGAKEQLPVGKPLSLADYKQYNRAEAILIKRFSAILYSSIVGKEDLQDDHKRSLPVMCLNTEGVLSILMPAECEEILQNKHSAQAEEKTGADKVTVRSQNFKEILAQFKEEHGILTREFNNVVEFNEFLVICGVTYKENDVKKLYQALCKENGLNFDETWAKCEKEQPAQKNFLGFNF